MPMLPFMAVFAAAGAVWLAGKFPRREWKSILPAALLIAVAAFFSNRNIVAVDTSNEWNKAGIILRSIDKPAEAEAAFRRALAANPGNPFSYLNLASLLESKGRIDESRQLRHQADAMMRGMKISEQVFIQNLKEK